MIYTVTFNPSLDYIIAVEDFRLGLTNRTSSEQLLPGGKGINVSIVLHNLGFDSTALGFTAGFVGAEITRRLQEMGIHTDFIPIGEGNSRINIKLKSIDGTEINGQGPELGEDAAALLMERLDILTKGDILFLAGSVPGSIPDDIYRVILGRLAGRGVMTVVDASRDLLVKVLPYRPFLIKPNHHELGEIFGVTLRERDEAIPYGRKLQEMGARNVLISMAGEGAVLVAEDGSVRQERAPEGRLVNGVGAGDSMAAGFVAGWLERQDYAHAFHMGLAAGSASAFSETFCTRAEVEALYNRLARQDDRGGQMEWTDENV